MECEGTEHNHHPTVDPGSFDCHFVSATSLLTFGGLWTYNALFRYHVALRQAVLRGSDVKKLSYNNMLFSKYHSGWAQAAPVEAFAVIFAWLVLSFGNIGSYYYGLPLILVFHHILIYFFYGAVATVNILQHYKFAVPPTADYAMIIIANAVQAFLLSNHLSGRATVDQQMHRMLVYMNIAIIVCLGLEIIYKRSVTAALGRTLIIISQSIVLYALGFIVFPLSFMHKFDMEDPTLKHIVPTFGAAAIAIAVLIIMIMNFIVSKRVEKMNLATVNRIVALTHYRRVSSGSKCDVESPLISDSDH